MHILQTDTKGNVVADLGPPVPEDTPANLEMEVTIKALSRPSREAETEVHEHLAPRLEAHLRRIEAWDLRGLPEEVQCDARSLTKNIRKDFCELGDTLEEMATKGFVAKTTAASRKRAALRCSLGKPVKLRPDIHAKTVGLFYSDEELATLTVSRVGESSVLVRTAEGREIGPLSFSQVELVE